jgi:hypothetical protein
MEETGASPQEINRHVRPPMLTMLCVLTFIGSGLMMISFMMLGLFYDTFVTTAKETYKNLPGLDIILETPPWAFTLTALANALSFAGALLMWKMRKKGFHAYTLAQFILLFLSSFAIYPGSISFGDLLLSLMFVLLYASHLRVMHD